MVIPFEFLKPNIYIAYLNVVHKSGIVYKLQAKGKHIIKNIIIFYIYCTFLQMDLDVLLQAQGSVSFPGSPSLCHLSSAKFRRGDP